ncbi:MAG: sigma-54 dependent transcriptional regulator [Spirochaetaceae bacterium]|jgi:two-component system response regulator AtoC|nr:sigma-54 dependent transcriptional regulator [Spirochaetaceae bacterium]
MAILIVDDEKNIRSSLKKYLGLEGIESEYAESGEAALGFLERDRFDAVLLDLKLPGMSGQEVLEWIQQRGIRSPVIMISAHGQISDAVLALKSGAKDYLVKPFDPAELVIKLRALLENRRREDMIEAGKRTDLNRESGLIGNTEAMSQLSRQIDKIASTDVTVLVTGESGTGKEVAAREIHARSLNRDEPFVAVNIGGIHEGLMESELFGHEKGAFTGAVNRKPGLFELAGKGCLFLDEIGEMPLPLQVKLLRVLQERKIRRLGGMNDIPVNARIVSATNRDLEAMVRDGSFREDLYYRLNVFRIELPPLRERAEDIPLLIDHLLNKLASRMGRSVPKIAPEGLDKLCSYAYPGNIRELENILERGLIYSDGHTIKPEDMNLCTLHGGNDESLEPSSGVQTAAKSLESIEKEAIRDALTQYQGNRTKAAEALGISRKTILNKIKVYKLKSPEDTD